MFERLFGAKKKKIEGVNSDKNSVEGVAHFDGTKTEEDLLGVDNEYLQDGFDEKDAILKKNEGKRNWYWDDVSSAKVSNERNHPKIGEKHSNWKEREPFALDLSEDDEETIDEKHLNALAESYDDEDDFEEEHREAA
jgi:hypothetical protein